MSTSLTRLQAVSKLQATLCQLYATKMWLSGMLINESIELFQSRPGGQVFASIDPAALDFVNTQGRRYDENKVKYSAALTAAKEVSSVASWEQVSETGQHHDVLGPT